MQRGIAVALAIASLLWAGGWSSGAAEDTTDVGSGRELFAANCAMCHGEDASGMMGMHPSLRSAIDRLTVEGVEVTIRNGRRTQPPMPAFGGTLDEGQIDAVVAYLDTLPPGPRNFGPDSGDGGMGGGMGDGMMGGGAMLLVPLVVLVLVVLGVIALVRFLTARGRDTGTPTAREILDRRYAEGELSREEYLQLRDDLDGG